MPWTERFDDPIVLPDGRTLRTLRDAIKYLAESVAKEDHGASRRDHGFDEPDRCGRRARLHDARAHRHAQGVKADADNVMTVYCRGAALPIAVRDLGCGVGRIPCMECHGTGRCLFPVEMTAIETCVDCKGSGTMLVGL